MGSYSSPLNDGFSLRALGEQLTNKERVVHVVDDDPAVCASLKFSLELEGYSVRTHASGPELLEDESLAAAACVILDYRMPDMDGLAVLSELASRSVKVPVILITAPVSESLRRRATQQGVFSLLEKPLLGNVLVRNVRDATSI
jgi:two-component system response regulator FixJ